jgi:hypothetical protein
MAGILLTSLSLGIIVAGAAYFFSKTQYYKKVRTRTFVLTFTLTITSIIQLFLGYYISGDWTQAILPSLEAPYFNPGIVTYGALWYGIMEAMKAVAYPLGSLFGISHAYSLAGAVIIFNMPVLTYLSWKHLRLLTVYAVLTYHAWFPITVWITDWNMPIAWLTIMGLVNPLLLFLPLIAKFPVGAPLAVWQGAFHNATGMRNLLTYIPLGVLWLAVLSRHIGPRIAHLLENSMPLSKLSSLFWTRLTLLSGIFQQLRWSAVRKEEANPRDEGNRE